MPSGWENAPEYGSRGSWVSTLASAVAVVVFGFALANCSVEAAKEKAQTETPPAPVSNNIVGVASVIDGDTIEIHGERIRLSGFDSPESGKRCGATNVYQQASLALSDFIGQRTVECVPSGTDGERIVATCSVGGTDLGEHMVTQGWGRDWPRYSNGAYADEEATARGASRGIWALQCPADTWSGRDYSERR